MAFKRLLLGMAIGAIAANVYANSSRSRSSGDRDRAMAIGDDALGVDDLGYAADAERADFSDVAIPGRTDDLLEPDATSPRGAREPSTSL